MPTPYDLFEATDRFLAGQAPFDDAWVIAIEIIPQYPPDHPVGRLAGLLVHLRVMFDVGEITTDDEARAEIRAEMEKPEHTGSVRTSE